MINPVIGGGIPIAMQSGVLLADKLTAGDRESLKESAVADNFARAWKSAFAKKFAYGRCLGEAERSAAGSRFVLAVLGLLPALLSGLVRMSRPRPAA